MERSMIDAGWMQARADRLGFGLCREFDPALLVPEERIRAYCIENRCGSYDAHHMCPPRVGSLPEIAAQLRRCRQGFLLQYSRPLDVGRDVEGVVRTKLEFHRLVLRLEKHLARRGLNRIWGLIGGNCGLCRRCAAVDDRPCRHPEKARASLEALGVDVVGLLGKLGLEGRFLPDRVTWTGCILLGEDPG